MDNKIPTGADFAKYRVTDQNQSEVIRQRLFDYQLYPLAGLQEFTFFSQGVGQGVTSTNGAAVGSGKTRADTNMQLNGQLPSGMEYLIESIEVDFTPGTSATANTFIPAGPTTAATAVLAAAPVSAVMDMNLVYNTGLLTFTVLNKQQLQETPLRSFPPKTWMQYDSSLATTNATLSLAVSKGSVQGRPYYLEPPISLQPASSFTVSIATPGAQALPSGFNGRLGVIFDGYLRRAAQ